MVSGITNTNLQPMDGFTYLPPSAITRSFSFAYSRVKKGKEKEKRKEKRENIDKMIKQKGLRSWRFCPLVALPLVHRARQQNRQRRRLSDS